MNIGEKEIVVDCEHSLTHAEVSINKKKQIGLFAYIIDCFEQHNINIVTDNTALLAVLLVGGFCLWKFVLQPIMNEDEPIEPPKDYKTFGEQMEEAVNTSTEL